MNKRLATCCALMVMVLLPAAAIAQTEILIWHSYRGEERAALEKVVEAFNAAHSGSIVAKTLAVPHDAYADKVTAAVPRGKGPDVFIYAQDRLGGWVEAGGTIEPIDFFLDEEIEGRYIPSTLEAMTYQDTVYGLPVNFKVLTLIYNKQLVSQPPKTSAELVTTAKKLTNAASGRFGLAYSYADFYYHSGLMNAFGGGVFDAKRQPTVDRPENVKAIELMMKWYLEDKILPAEPTSALITNLFNEGRAAMVFSGPWFLGEIKDGVDFGLAPLPTLDEAGGQPIKPWMTIEGAYIAEPSEHKDEAFEFVSFLTGIEGAEIMAIQGRQTPANKGVYDLAAVQGDAVLQAFRAQADVGVPMPNYAEMTMMWSPATTAMNTVVKQAASAKTALERAQEDVIERIKALRQ